MASTERMCAKPPLHAQPRHIHYTAGVSPAGGGGGYSHFFLFSSYVGLEPVSTVYPNMYLEYQAYPKIYLKF